MNAQALTQLAVLPHLPQAGICVVSFVVFLVALCIFRESDTASPAAGGPLTLARGRVLAACL